MKKKFLMSVTDYAKACEVGAAAIYLRAAKKEITLDYVSGCYYVNTTKYPIIKKRSGGRPKASTYINKLR